MHYPIIWHCKHLIIITLVFDNDLRSNPKMIRLTMPHDPVHTFAKLSREVHQTATTTKNEKKNKKRKRKGKKLSILDSHSILSCM